MTPPPPANDPGTPQGRALSLACAAALVLLALWLSVPGLRPSHLEAYSMTLLGMAADLARGGQDALYARDPAMPLVSAYLYLTRPGTVHALSSLGRVVGFENAWTVLVWANWAATLLSCAAFARARGVPVRHGLLAGLLVQGIASAAGSHNETLPWAALVAGAAAAVPDRLPPQREWAMLLPGFMLGAAFLMRQDALAGGAVVFAALAAAAPSLSVLLRSAAFLGAGFLLAVLGLSRGFGVSVWEGLEIARAFTALRAEAGASWWPETVLYAVGLPLLALVPLGLRAGGTRAALLFSPAALLVWAASTWMSSNPRYVLPALFPLLVLWGGEGLRRLFLILRGPRRVGAGAVVAIVLALCVAPPALLNASDGPNVLVGRASAVPAWLSWQARVRQDERAMRDFVDGLPPGRTTVVTAHYDDDAALRLRMSLGGWNTAWMEDRGEGGCRGGTLHWDARGREVLHVRAVAFYAVTGRVRENEALFPLATLDCPDLLAGSRVVLASSWAMDYYADPAMWGDGLAAWMRLDPRLRFRELSHDEVGELVLRLRGMAARARWRDGTPLGVDEFLAAYRGE